MNQPLHKTLELLTLLFVPESDRDRDWQVQFDETIFEAVLEIRPQALYQHLPSGVPMLQLHQPPHQQEFDAVQVGDVMDEVVSAHAGIQLRNLQDEIIFTLSPGDCVGLWVNKTPYVNWQGKWGQPAETTLYTASPSSGNAVSVMAGPPPQRLLSPLSARNLEWIFGQLLERHPELERTPSIACIRLTSEYDNQAVPSDLCLNIYGEEFADPDEFSVWQSLFWDHLPIHEGNRLIFTHRPLLDPRAFTPLRDLYTEDDIPVGFDFDGKEDETH